MENNTNEENKLNPEEFMKNIQEKDSNNLYLLNYEKLALDIFSYLQDKSFPVSDKIIIDNIFINSLIIFQLMKKY